MSLNESSEMYLETIYRLSLKSTTVRSIDVAEALGYSRPSVSRAVSLLKQGEYLVMDKNGFLSLTEDGLIVAKKIFERHNILAAALIALGVDTTTAAEDACRIEHVISDKAFEALRKHMQFYGRA